MEIKWNKYKDDDDYCMNKGVYIKLIILMNIVMSCRELYCL